MRRHTTVRSYCRYYYRMSTVVMTIVTTVAIDYHITTNAIFSHLQMPDVGHRFKKPACIFHRTGRFLPRQQRRGKSLRRTL